MLNPDQTVSATGRGERSGIRLKNRYICYEQNGQRSVQPEKTIRNIESFFLKSTIEAQFSYKEHKSCKISKAILTYYPSDEPGVQYFFGKGLTAGQSMISACFEFFERYCARMFPNERILEHSFNDVKDIAIDPAHFSLATNSGYHDTKTIDWVFGFSLSRKKPVLVPANMVFYPYETTDEKKYISRSDSNGLAAGNNIEEAVLHGLLEIIERDQSVISEYNRMPFRRIAQESVPLVCRPALDHLAEKGFKAYILSGSSDLPIPFIIVFLHSDKNPANCSVAYGCHPDPLLAIERALTEAVQLLPPSVNHTRWLKSGSPQFYMSGFTDEIQFDAIESHVTSNIRENIEILVSYLKKIESEVIVVDLSHPDIPFPSVRVLATKLQPCIRKDSMRLSERFFRVPVKLGFRNHPLPASEVKIWPVCGYK